jgi:hypothetical protein
MLRDRCGPLDAGPAERQARLDAAIAERAVAERTHLDAIAHVQHRYEALSEQLLQEAAHQRDALKKEHAQSASQPEFGECHVLPRLTVKASVSKANSLACAKHASRHR